MCSVSKERCRFSYMGGRGGPLWKRLRFRLPQGGPAGASPSPGTLEIEHADGASAVHETFFWNFLKESIQEYRFVEDEAREQLPFNFWGGYVGYLGYELKAECGSPNRHRSPHPDACLFLSDRSVPFLVDVTNLAASLGCPLPPPPPCSVSWWDPPIVLPGACC